MTYRFRYFVIKQHFTHIAKIINMPEAKLIEKNVIPEPIETEIKYYPHCVGEWKEIDINFLTVICYMFCYGIDWQMQMEYELTGKFRERNEVRMSELIKV